MHPSVVAALIASNSMSRGCVNMTNEDAQWLFDWAFPQWDGDAGWFKPTDENATLVIVHE